MKKEWVVVDCPEGACERSFLAEPMRESSMRRDDDEVARLSFEQLSHPYLDGLCPAAAARNGLFGDSGTEGTVADNGIE